MEPKIVFSDNTAKNPVTLFSYDAHYAYKIDKEKLEYSKTLAEIVDVATLTQEKPVLPASITTPHTVALLLHHLYMSEENRKKYCKQHSSKLIMLLANISNYLEIPTLLSAYTQRMATFIQDIKDVDEINTYLERLQKQSKDILHVTTQCARDTKVHIYWLQQTYNAKNKAFFICPDSSIRVTQDYTKVEKTDILHEGVGTREQINGERLCNIPEYTLLCQLSLEQYLLLLYAKKREEEKQPLNLDKLPTLQKAFTSLSPHLTTIKKILNSHL